MKCKSPKVSSVIGSVSFKSQPIYFCLGDLPEGLNDLAYFLNLGLSASRANFNFKSDFESFVLLPPPPPSNLEKSPKSSSSPSFLFEEDFVFLEEVVSFLF